MGRLSDLTGQRVYLDANVLIYFVEGYATTEAIIRPLFSMIAAGHIMAVTSELTLTETLVKPLREGNAAAVRAYQQLLSGSGGIETLAISRNILMEAANLRSQTSLKLPDAIHAATAAHSACTTLITNDQRLPPFAGITREILTQLLP